MEHKLTGFGNMAWIKLAQGPSHGRLCR